MEEAYSNREIDEKFHDIKDSLDRIEAQTTKTNGLVAGIIRWRERLMGATTVFVLIVLPILGWALYTLANIQNTVDSAAHQAVQDELSKYTVKITN